MARIDTTDPDAVINPNKIMWWLLCTITSILLVAGAAWGSAVASRQQVLDDRQVAQAAQIALLGEKLSVIEGKVDILLQRTPFLQPNSIFPSKNK